MGLDQNLYIPQRGDDVKKKIKDLTIGECVAICKKHRVTKIVANPCSECPLGGYYCNVIFGMRYPEQLDDEFFCKRNKPIVLEDEIEF